eukprot:2577581-Rhodomonas_salina.2
MMCRGLGAERGSLCARSGVIKADTPKQPPPPPPQGCSDGLTLRRRVCWVCSGLSARVPTLAPEHPPSIGRGRC